MVTQESLVRYELALGDVGALDALIAELRDSGQDPASQQFFDQTWRYEGRLPHGVRGFLEDFRRCEPGAACMISGFPVDDGKVGPTPRSWTEAAELRTTWRQEFWLALVAASLGETFSWSTLQMGRMIHNVIPVQGEETQQSGHGSKVLLEWHTEDGFHPYRCDYLLLLGIRNRDRVPTTMATIRDVRLEAWQTEVLFQERFHILPDDEHLRQLAARHPDHPGLQKMRRMREDPVPVAVLFGAEERPYLRIDPYFMRCLPGDAEAEAALKAVVDGLERAQRDIVVGPGDLLVIDNYLAVHGRRAFEARYDGTDRWLKKALVTRDLRKSRELRDEAAARVLV